MGTKKNMAQIADELREHVARRMTEVTRSWAETAPLRDKSARIRDLITKTGWCSKGSGPAVELAMLLAGLPLGATEASYPTGVCVSLPDGRVLARVMGGQGHVLHAQDGSKHHLDSMMLPPTGADGIEAFVAVLPAHHVFDLAATMTMPAT